MRKFKNGNAAIKFIKIKTGTVEGFFAAVKQAMRSIDKGEVIEKCCATLTFAEPSEALRFIAAAKIK